MTEPANEYGSGTQLPESATLSLSEAAAILGIHRNTASGLIRKNQFPVPVFRVGGLWKVSKERLLAYIEGR